MGAGTSGGRNNSPARQPLEEGAGGSSQGRSGGSSVPRSRGSLAGDDILIHQETRDHGTRQVLVSQGTPTPLGLLDGHDGVDEGSSLSSYPIGHMPPAAVSMVTTGDSSSSPEPSISETQLRNVRHCLATLEGNLQISLRVDNILSGVEVITYRQDEEVLRQGGNTRGIYVVDEGALKVLSPTGDVVINRLLPGEFCGELSTIFGVLCTATVHAEHRSTLLLLPYHIITDNLKERPRRREQLLQWCAKRSYIDTSQTFGAGVLLQQVIANCLEASLFGNLSKEAIKFMSELAMPILFSDGDVLYSPGEEPSHLFLVLRGVVECSANDKVLSVKDIKSSDEGYCIGSEDFFRGHKRTSKTRCTGPLLVVPVSGDLLALVADKYPKDLPKFKNYYSSVA